MAVIWKQVLETRDAQEIAVPSGARFVHCATQRDAICLWYSCDPTNVSTRWLITIVGTGHTFDPDVGDHLGSVLLMNEALVFHVYGKNLAPETFLLADGRAHADQAVGTHAVDEDRDQVKT